MMNQTKLNLVWQLFSRRTAKELLSDEITKYLRKYIETVDLIKLLHYNVLFLMISSSAPDHLLYSAL